MNIQRYSFNINIETQIFRKKERTKIIEIFEKILIIINRIVQIL